MNKRKKTAKEGVVGKETKVKGPEKPRGILRR